MKKWVSMIQIDNKKMWESLLSLAALPPELHTLIEVALSDQNLEWNGKEIVSIELKQDASGLKESEDENIRKELIDHCHQGIKQRTTVVNKESYKRWIAWLEKQGEQKPVEEISGNYGGISTNSEWSEEDKGVIDKIIGLFQFSESFAASGITNNDTKEVENWLKSICPQNKQEWSKEDVEMIEWLIRCCEKEHEELCNDRYGHQEIVSDLKRDCRKKRDWLESLKGKVVPQKQWKPSEEQIQHLKTVAEIAEDEGYITSGHEVRKLIEQLKAL